MHYHIVGIAGAGMSAIANLLLDQGHAVSGSDLSANRLTAALAARGATIYAGHDPAYVTGAAALVTTSAARADHPELAAARSAGIPVLKRADLWRDWSQQRQVIAVAGTAGKTTTTAMIAVTLSRAGIDPGFLIGGESPDLGVNARWGDSAAPLVIEADEYDYAFLALTPRIAVVTNVEWDHPDIYPTAEDYTVAFVQFAAQTRELLLVHEQWPAWNDAWPARRLTYGLNAGNDYRAILADGGFTIACNARPATPAITLGLPGLHNIANALAAFAVADQLGVDPALAVEALRTFRGTARRFELKGVADGVTVIDDYAHHPAKVRATLAAARDWAARRGAHRLVVYFQPHTFSRTLALFEEWPTAFAAADLVLVGDIYPAREAGDPADLARRLTNRIAAVHPQVAYAGDLTAATEALLALVRPGDLVLTLGAGDGQRVGEDLLARRHDPHTTLPTDPAASPW